MIKKNNLAALILKPEAFYMLTPWKKFRPVLKDKPKGLTGRRYKSALVYPAPDQVVKTGVRLETLEDPALLYQHLLRIKKSYHLHRLKTTLVLPEDHFVLRTLEIPQRVEKYLLKYLKTEHMTDSIVPLQAPLFTAHVLERRGESVRVLIWAVEEHVLEQYVTVFEALNWQISGFLHPGMALGSWLGEGDTGLIMIVFVQVKGVSFYIYEKRWITFSRFFPWEPDFSLEDAEPVIRPDQVARISDYMVRLERFTRTTLHPEGLSLEKVYVFMEKSGMEEAGISIRDELSNQFGDISIEILALKWPAKWPKQDALGLYLHQNVADLYVAAGALLAE